MKDEIEQAALKAQEERERSEQERKRSRGFVNAFKVVQT